MVITRNQGVYLKGFYTKSNQSLKSNENETKSVQKRIRVSNFGKLEFNQLKIQIQHQLMSNLKPKSRQSSIVTIKARISNQLASYFSKSYGIKSKFVQDNELINSLNLKTINFLSKDNLIKVQENSFQIKLAKKRSVTFLDSNLVKQKIQGLSLFCIKFKKEEIVINQEDDADEQPCFYN
ncbi:hypothetical protein BpHYR1_053898 [Brachionus plicatilis]|uniref:Uncharacterized protein n=1 Tax=Brachionus plicatilis TaxID=10195 RepID=A0A3M7PDU8_BRAPC|nr:hypothetical protein BpHYR1_053898 [Brachionus plicatilis]